MLGYDLLKYSIVCLFRNLRTIVPIIAPMLTLHILLEILRTWKITGTLLPLRSKNTPNLMDTIGPVTFFVVTFMAFICASILLAVIVIIWHRYVILNSKAPIFDRAIFWSYVVKLLKIVSLVISVKITIFIFLRVFIDPQSSDDFYKYLALIIMDLRQPSPIAAFDPFIWIFWFTKAVVFIWLGHRVSLCLPAAAIGKSMSLQESWKETSIINGQIMLLACLETLLYLSISLAIFWVSPIVGSVAAWTLGLLYVWIQTLYGASIITTMYRYLIENKPLNVI